MAQAPPIAHIDAEEFPPTRKSLESRHLSRSQASSFNESVASQSSEMQVSNLEFSQAQQLQQAGTPATSVSPHSSQERATAQVLFDHGDAKGGSSVPTILTRRSHTTAQLSPPRLDHTSAPKRMANGEIKTSNENSPVRLESSDIPRHSRNTSSAFNSSEMRELANSLRTRLKYAAFKVQHGLEGHTLSELEEMISHNGSPVSANSDRGPPNNHSPSDDSRYTTTSSQTLRTTHPRVAQISPPTTLSPGRPAQQQTSTQHPNLTTQAATYESFWNNHSAANTANAPSQHAYSLTAPSLAPPADILSRSNTHRATKPPPILQTTAMLPSTPQRRPPTSTRTPSQQAAEEKDAIETLLFMSSPGNSGHYPPATATGQSPLRQTLRTPISASARSKPELMALRGFPSPNLREVKEGRKSVLTNRDIDRMIDKIEGESSEDEDGSIVERTGLGSTAIGGR